MPCHPSAKPSSPTGCFRWDVSAAGKHPWNQKQTKPSRMISGLALNHLKTPQQHRAAVSKCGKHTREAENGAGTQNISQTPAVCWGQFAQGLSLSVMVSLYPLALEGFVLCALKKPSFPHIHTAQAAQASLRHPSGIKPRLESRSKSQLPVGPVRSSLVETNNLSGSIKGPTE